MILVPWRWQTILPLKASLESGLLERSDHYLNYTCARTKRKMISTILVLSKAIDNWIAFVYRVSFEARSNRCFVISLLYKNHIVVHNKTSLGFNLRFVFSWNLITNVAHLTFSHKCYSTTEIIMMHTAIHIFNRSETPGFVPPMQLKRCHLRQAFCFIINMIWGTRHIPLLERSRDRKWQYYSSISVEETNKQGKKQTKALALRSCFGVGNNKKKKSFGDQWCCGFW